MPLFQVIEIGLSCLPKFKFFSKWNMFHVISNGTALILLDITEKRTYLVNNDSVLKAPNLFSDGSF